MRRPALAASPNRGCLIQADLARLIKITAALVFNNTDASYNMHLKHVFQVF
jgi:hypothetical protein